MMDTKAYLRPGPAPAKLGLDRTKGGELVQLHAWLPADMVETLRLRAEASGKNQRDIVAEALRAWFAAPAQQAQSQAKARAATRTSR